MKAELLLNERVQFGDNAFAEVRVWRVAEPVRGSRHGFKYSLAYVVNGVCELRYDNEAGKGDHRHLGVREEDYDFVSMRRLMRDFGRDVAQRRGK